ncbi:MAG: efflux RND transporter periplasmic adaptor subunit [Dysgonamonadaceae bacterium]|jgi:RND family efflux transporter MFP subunit|nr:efflux RND transporter periplasmic adaptor subunit [Dysgonamonadaceae bacterium]
MNRKIPFRFLPIACAAILLSCGGGETKQEEKSNRVKVNVTTAKTQSVEQTSTYTATVEADIINQITPAMGGRIEKILVEVGDRVGKGQLLVQMESSNLRQQTTQLANLERDYERYSELLKVGGIAQQQVDQIKTQIDVLRTAINNINDNTQLRSPIAGVITARNYDNGDVFTAQPVLTVQQLNVVKARINVSESHFTNVKLGMPVDIKLDVYGKEAFTGKVTLIYPTIDAASHTFGVEVTIDNRGMKVRPGMYARVSVNFGTGESIVIPDRCVMKQAGANDKYVFTVENGVAHYHKVELGQRIADSYEITSGIVNGDVVVMDGQTRLIEGTEVEVVKEN